MESVIEQTSTVLASSGTVGFSFGLIPLPPMGEGAIDLVGPLHVHGDLYFEMNSPTYAEVFRRFIGENSMIAPQQFNLRRTLTGDRNLRYYLLRTILPYKRESPRRGKHRDVKSRKPMKMRADKVSRKEEETMMKKKTTSQMKKKVAEEPCTGFMRVTGSSWGRRRRFFRKCSTNNAAEPPCRGLLETLCRMGINNPVCVLRKKLTPTDIDDDQNRLQVSKKEFDKALRKVMTKEEEEQVKDGMNGLKVTVLDALAREYHMIFKLVSNKYYRFITTDYKKFVRNNQLKAGETLDVWACRRGQQGGGCGEVEGGRRKEGELLLAMLQYESVEEEKVPTDEDEKIIEAAFALTEMASSGRW